MQELSMVEYGGKIDKWQDTNVLFTHKGFEQVGTGVRMDLPGPNDIVC